MTDTTGRTQPQSFYLEALSEAEQAALPEARDLSGIEEEIAVLRVRLRTAVHKEPEKVDLMLRGLTTLVRLTTARYGLSAKDATEFGAYAGETLRRLRERATNGADHDDA